MEKSKRRAQSSDREEDDAATKPKVMTISRNEDLEMLLERIDGNIPENDNLSFTTRLEKLSWQTVAFGKFTADECKQTWYTLQKRVRKYRILRELLADVRRECLDKSPHTPHTNHVNKKLRHPDMPKQPYNNYLFFVQEHRLTVAKQNPHWTPNEVAKELGVMYKRMQPPEKAKYDQLASEAKREYEEKMREFYNKHPEWSTGARRAAGGGGGGGGGGGAGTGGGGGGGGGAGTGSDGEPPRKPRSPFDLFYQMETYKESGKVVDKGELMQSCKQRWGETGDEDKLFWISWAEEDFNRYIDAFHKYKKSHPGCHTKPLKTVLNKKEQAIRDQLMGKPVRPPMTAFQLFTKLTLQSAELNDCDNRDVMETISNRWKNCTEQDRHQYKLRVEQMWAQYRNELEKYLETVPSTENDQVQNTKSLYNKRNATNTIATSTKKRRKINIKEPDMPPVSEVEYFTKIYSGNEDPKKVWKQMTKDQKKQYQDLLLEEKRKYIIAYEEYLKSLSKEQLDELARSNKKIEGVDAESSDSSNDSNDSNDDADNNHDDNDDDDDDDDDDRGGGNADEDDGSDYSSDD